MSIGRRSPADARTLMKAEMRKEGEMVRVTEGGVVDGNDNTTCVRPSSLCSASDGSRRTQPAGSHNHNIPPVSSGTARGQAMHGARVQLMRYMFHVGHAGALCY